MRSAAAATILTCLVIAGCGGDDGPSGDARKGGSITIGATSLPAILDPALATDPRALQALWAVYTPPLSYRHAEGREGTELVPGLAREMPRVSDDRLTYSFRLRRGLRYSNGIRLRASDFVRAIERARRLRSPYAELFSRVGSIEASDRSGRVVVNVVQLDPTFLHALALPVAAPVPPGTPERDLSERPPPGIGAYRVAGIRPGERVVLRRDRGFDLPDLPAGNVDEITIERFGNAERQAEEVATGTTLDVMQELPPTERLPEIRSRYDDRYLEEPTASTLLYSIDRSVPPFTDPRLRQAVSLAVDGPRLKRLYAGRLAPGCNLLPPSVRGYSELDPCPYGSRSEPPDLVRARDLVEEAKAEGTDVVVAADPSVSPPAASRYFTATLRKIGLAAVSVPSARRPGVELELLAPPVAHPASYLAGFQGRTGFALDADLGRVLADPEPQDEDWAGLDARLVEEAGAAPLGTQTLPTFFSERIDVQGCAVFHPIFGTDLAGLCLR